MGLLVAGCWFFWGFFFGVVLKIRLKRKQETGYRLLPMLCYLQQLRAILTLIFVIWAHLRLSCAQTQNPLLTCRKEIEILGWYG